MMNDLKNNDGNIESIAVLNSESDERKDVDRAIDVLRSAARVVVWQDKRQRDEFIDEVEATATDSLVDS